MSASAAVERANADARDQRMRALRGELEQVAEELQETEKIHQEAQELGDESLLEEIQGDLARLQEVQQELQQELNRLQLASQRSAENLRERLRRLRSRDANHRRLLSGEEGELQAAASAAAASIGRTVSGGPLKEGIPAPSAALPDIPEAAPSDPPTFNQPSVAISAAATVAAALAPASSSQTIAQESVAALAADSGFQGTPDSVSLWAGFGSTPPLPAPAGAMPVGTGMDLQPPSAQQMPVASTGSRALETPALPELPASGSAQRQPAAGAAAGITSKQQQAVAALPVAGAATERALSGYTADTEEADVVAEGSAALSQVAAGAPGSKAQHVSKPGASKDVRSAALAETISGALAGAGGRGEAATGATGREAGQPRPDPVEAEGPKAAALAATVSGALSAAGEGHTSGLPAEDSDPVSAQERLASPVLAADAGPAAARVATSLAGPSRPRPDGKGIDNESESSLAGWGNRQSEGLPGSDETSPAELTTLNSFGTSHLREQAVGESPKPLASPMSSMDKPQQDSVGRDALTDEAASMGQMAQQQQDRPAVPASVFGSSIEPAASQQQPIGLQVPASAFGSSGAPESGEQQQAQPSAPVSTFSSSSDLASGEQQQGRPLMPGSSFGSSDHVADTGGPVVLPASPFEQARSSGTAAASLGAAQQSSARAVNAQELELRPSKNVLPPKSSFAADEVQAAGLNAQAAAPVGQVLEMRPSKNVLPPKSSFAADEVQTAGLEAEARPALGQAPEMRSFKNVLPPKSSFAADEVQTAGLEAGARAARAQALGPRPSKNVLPPESSLVAEEVQAMGRYQGSEGSSPQDRGLQDAEAPASGFATPEGGDSPLREGGQEPQAPAAAAPSAGAASDQGSLPSHAAEAAHGQGQAGPASEPAPQPGTADGNLRRINSISSPRRKAPPPPGRGPGPVSRQSNVGVKQQEATSKGLRRTRSAEGVPVGSPRRPPPKPPTPTIPEGGVLADSEKQLQEAASTEGPARHGAAEEDAAVIQPVAGWKSFEEPAEQLASSQLVQRQSTGGDIWGSLPLSAGTEQGVDPAGTRKQQAGMPREAAADPFGDAEELQDPFGPPVASGGAEQAPAAQGAAQEGVDPFAELAMSARSSVAGGDTAPWYELGRGVSGNPFQQFMPLDSYLSGDAAGAMPEGGQEAEQLAASQPAEAAQSQEAAPAEKGASSGRHVAAAVSAVEAGGARGPPAAQQAEHEPAIGSRLPTPQPGAPQAPAAEAGPTEVAALQAAAAARSSLPETGRLQAAPQASQGAGGPPPASAFGEDSAFEASSSFEAPTSGADRQTLPEISFDGAENAFGAGSFPAEATSSRAGGQPLPPSTFGGEESAFGASSFPAEAASSRAAAAPGPPPGEAPGSGPSSGAWEPAAPQVPQGLGSDAFEAEWPSELGVGQQRVASPYTFSQPTLAAAGAGPAAGQAHAGPAAQPCSAEAVHPEASQPEASGAALTQPGGPPQQQQQQKGLGSPVASASGVDVSRAFAPGSTNSVRQLSEMFKAEQQQPPRQAAAGRGLGRGRGRGHSFSEVDLWLPMDPEERRQMEDAFEAKGYSAVRFQRSDADALWKLRAMPPDQFGRAWQLSDVDCDGALSRAEFILFMYFVGSFSRKGLDFHLPEQPLTLEQAARLTGSEGFQAPGRAPAEPAAEEWQAFPEQADLQRVRQATMPVTEADTEMQQQALQELLNLGFPPVPAQTALQAHDWQLEAAANALLNQQRGAAAGPAPSRSAPPVRPQSLGSPVLRDAGGSMPSSPANGRSPSGKGLVRDLSGFSSRRSTGDTGSARSTRSTLSPTTGGVARQTTGASTDFDEQGETSVGGMTVSPGRDFGAQARYAFESPQRDPASSMVARGDSKLTIGITAARMKYTGIMERPFFTVSLRTQRGQLIEPAHNTLPALWDGKNNVLKAGDVLALSTPVRSLPDGSLLYFELKHYKPKEKKMSLRAWSVLAAETLVDYSAEEPSVHVGPLHLSLLQKPVDFAQSRKHKRLTNEGLDLDLLIGVMQS